MILSRIGFIPRPLADNNASFHRACCVRKPSTSSKTANFSIEEATYRHTMHCADVPWQALLCAADSSLICTDEDIKWPGDGGRLICRNFEALKDWTLRHEYVSDLGGVFDIIKPFKVLQFRAKTLQIC